MVINLIANNCVLAVAYNAHNVSVRWPCTILRILYSKTQFGIYLKFSLPSHGVDDSILFRYEGNNFIPGGILFEKHDIPLPVNSGRNGESKPGTLCLTLKDRCSVWYSKTCSSFYADFPKLLPLARSQHVCIDFDTQWLGKNLDKFEGLFKIPQEFAEIPVLQQFTDEYERAHWPLLECIPDPDDYLASGVIPSIEIAGADASLSQEQANPPPPYTGKRSRHTDCSLTSDPDTPDPDSKRARERSPSEAKRDESAVTEPVDLFQEAVALAVQKELAVFKKELAQGVKGELRVVKGELSVVKKELSVVKKELAAKELAHTFEEGFWRMLAGRSPTPPLSPQLPNAQISKAPPYHNQIPSRRCSIDSTEFQRKFEKAARQVLAPFIDDIVGQVSAEASEIIAAASAEMEVSFTDSKLDLAMVSEDRIAELNELCNRKLDEFDQQITERMEGADAQVEEAMLKFRDKVVDTLRQALLKYRCLHSACNKQNALGTNGRALSAPLSREGGDGTVKE